MLRRRSPCSMVARMSDALHSAGPGRVEIAQRLVTLGGEIAAGRRGGATVFVERRRERRARGAAARGRRGVRGQRTRSSSRAAWNAARSSPGSEDERPRGRSSCSRRVVPLAATLRPALELFSLVLAQSAKARQVVAQIAEQRGQIDPGLLLPQLLQLAAQERPVVCLVDCAPDAQAGWWEDLLTLFASEIAGPVRVLLVVGVEAARAGRRRAARAVRRADARAARAGRVVAARADRVRGRRCVDRARREAGGRGAVRAQRRAQRPGGAAVGGVAGRGRRRA